MEIEEGFLTAAGMAGLGGECTVVTTQTECWCHGWSAQTGVCATRNRGEIRRSSAARVRVRRFRLR